MAAPTPEVLADPLGVVVDLVAGVEPDLDRDCISEVVAGVAGGRAKRRRLAQALQARPGILTDGHSPAPEAIGKLLTALREAGAVNVSPPVCTECAKPIRAFQRRGQNWYCAVHGPDTAACVVCGNIRPVAQRDRQQQPHCWQCPLSEERDPTEVLIDLVASIDPVLDAQLVTAANPHRGAPARATTPTGLGLARSSRAAHRRWRPGTGSLSPTADRRARRARVRSHRPATLPTLRPGHRAGQTPRWAATVSQLRGQIPRRNVLAVRRAPRARYPRRTGTGVVSQVSDHRPGEPTDLPGLPTASSGQRPNTPWPAVSVVSARRDGDLFDLRALGSRLGLQAHRANVLPRLPATASSLQQLRQRQTGPQRNPPPTRCGCCTRPDAHWHACPGCGEHTQQLSRRCARCTLQRRLGELLRDDAGQIHPQLQVLHDNLANHQRPDTVLVWLNNDATSAIMRELVTEQRALTHAGLDELPDSKPVRHLRSVLVATGALPHRDEHLIRLEQWITATVADRADPEQRALLHRYASWHALHRLRRRNSGQHATDGQRVAVQRNITAAITLLDWLTSRGLDLASAGQGDLEQWLTSASATARVDAGNFVRWARRMALSV